MTQTTSRVRAKLLARFRSAWEVFVATDPCPDSTILEVPFETYVQQIADGEIKAFSNDTDVEVALHWLLRQRRLRDEVGHQKELQYKLEEDTGVSHDHPKASLLFDTAWVMGHHAGDAEVQHYYEHLVALIR